MPASSQQACPEGGDHAAIVLDLQRAPLSALHALIMGLCACGFAIDLMEVALGGALSTVFAAPPHDLSGWRLSLLVSSVYIGAIGGAPVMGWVADRIGLRTTLTYIVLWLAATSWMAAASVAPAWLVGSRLLGGLALGAYPPLMIAYLADIMPASRRSLAVFTVCALAYLAPPATLFAVRALTPIAPWGVEGWRWPLIVAGAACLAAAAAFSRLPEGPRWLLAAGRVEAAREAVARLTASRALLAPARVATPLVTAEGALPKATTRRRLALACAIYFLIPWATVAFPLLTGPILLARHFPLADALFYVGLAATGPAVATFIGGWFADRAEPRWLMSACAALMTASVMAFLFWPAKGVMAAAIIVFGLCSASFMPAMTLYGSQLFAPAVRGRATTLAWVCNRIAASLSPLLLMPLVQADGGWRLAAVMGLTLAACVALLLGAAPRLARPQVLATAG